MAAIANPCKVGLGVFRLFQPVGGLLAIVGGILHFRKQCADAHRFLLARKMLKSIARR